MGFSLFLFLYGHKPFGVFEKTGRKIEMQSILDLTAKSTNTGKFAKMYYKYTNSAS